MQRIYYAGGLLRPVFVTGLGVLGFLAGCRANGTTKSAAVHSGSALCVDGSASPATAAPAVGLWTGRRSGADVHVTARIGHPHVAGTISEPVSHHVETLETRRGKPPLRTIRNRATVRLEVLPPYLGDRAPSEFSTPAAVESHPVATYALPERVILASYESCGAVDPKPLVRYLRRDEVGQIVTDVLLHRLSAGP